MIPIIRMHSRDGLPIRAISLKALAITILIFIPFLLSGITSSQANIVERTNSEGQHISSNNPVFIAGDFQYFDLTLTVDEEKICIIAYSGDSMPDPYDRSVENYYKWEYDQGSWKDLSGHDSLYIKPSKCSKENNTYFFHIGIDHKANPGHWTIKVIVDEKEVSSTPSIVVISGFNFLLSAIIGIYEPVSRSKKSVVDIDFICSDRKRIMVESEKNVDILVDEVLSNYNPPSKKEKTVDDILDLSTFNSRLLTQDELMKSTVTTYPRSRLKKVQTNELNSLFFNEKGGDIKKTFLTLKTWSYNKLLAIIITIAFLSITVAPIITSSDFSPPSSPAISSFTLYPDEIISGETILFNVSASDTIGITSVFVDISEFERINLSLAEGINVVNDTVYSGFWQGEWLVQDLEPGVYATRITVMNLDNSSVSEKHVFTIVPDGFHDNTTQMDKQSYVTAKKDVDIIQNETLNKTTSQDVHNDSLVDNTTGDATENNAHVDQLDSDVEKVDTVFIVDKKHEEMMVLPGTRFYVERTINGPHGTNVTFAPMYSDALTLESIEIIEDTPTNINNNLGGDDPHVFDKGKAKSQKEQKVEQLKNNLSDEIKTLNKIAYDDVELHSTRTVRLWFRAPTWEEIQSGIKPSSGEISYLVFPNDESDDFDFEGSTWWSSNWDHRKLITINSSQVDADLVNFPVLVNITDADLRDDAQNDGDDIAFVLWGDNSTKLNHEIEFFNGTTGELVAWVNVTSLSSSVDTKIWIYYGNSTCSSQENIPGVWDSDYVGVWHLDETSGTTIYDSTLYGLNGTANSQITLNQAGKIGRSVDVSPSTGSIDSDVSLPATYSTWTVEGWLQLDSTPGWGDLWADSAGGELYPGQIWGGGTFGCYNSNQLQTTSTFPEDGTTWTYVTSKCDGSDTFVYWNGVQENSNSQQRTISGSWSIGDRTSSGEEMDGRVDEVRVSKIARNSSWIKTSYNAMYSPETFLSVGNKENITDTSVDAISPYSVTYLPYAITATADSSLDGVTLWYHYSTDNSSWDSWMENVTDISAPWKWNFNFSNGTGYYEFYSIGKKSGLPDEMAPGTADAICFFNESLNTPPFIDLISPFPNGTTDIDLQPTCSIWANDSEGDTLTIRWYENTTGGWILRNTNSSVSANSIVGYTFTEFSNYSATYWWKVSVNDSMDNTSAVYYFTTEPIQTSVDTISPYWVTSSPKALTASGSSDLDNVTLYYRWSSDNVSWGTKDISIFDGFESGSINSSLWDTYQAPGSDARIQFDYGGTTHGGSYSCAMDDNDADTGDSSLNELYTVYDFTGESNINIDFWQYDADDEESNAPSSWVGHGNYDAVSFTNDGNTWYEIIDAMSLDQDDQWTHYTYNISNDGNFNQNVNSNFAIKFQQYDNYQINLGANWDGRIWDDIYINSTTINDNGTDWIEWSNSGNPDDTYPWNWSFDFPNGTGYYEFFSIGNKSGFSNETAPGSADAICYYDPLGSAPTIALVSPIPNGTTDVNLQPMCQIWANDTNGDTLNVYWYENTTGSWILRNTNSSVSANSIVSYTFAEFNDYSTMYWWKVAVNDSTWNTTTVYYFTTEHIETSVDTIIPYAVTSSQLNITATASSTLDNVALWYRYSTDNSSWWNPSWSKRKTINLNTSSGSTPSNYQVLLNITYDDDMNTDFSDLRFVNYSDNSTELDYWIESKSDSNWAQVWIEIGKSITTANKTYAWMYYSNSDVTSASNGNNTFLFFDNFNDNSINTSKWTKHKELGSISEIGGYLECGGGSTSSPYGHTVLGSNNIYNTAYDNISIEGKIQQSTNAIGEVSVRGNYAFNDGFKGRWDCRSGSEQCFMSPAYNGWSGFGSSVTHFGNDDGSWHTIELQVTDNIAYIYMDGSQKNSVSVSSYTETGEISLQNHYGSYTRYDNIRVRKYVTAEPSLNSFGNEQSGGWVKWNNDSNPDKNSPWSWDFNFPNSTGYYEFYSIGNKSGSPNETVPGNADAICHYTYISPTAPVINSYDLSNSTGSKLNNATGLIDINNEYYFTINITDFNGWVDVDYIEIKAWYDNGSESTTYNQTQGGNLNMYLQYENITGTANFSLLWPDDEVQLISGNCTEAITDETTRIINISFKPGSQVRWASSNYTWNTAQNTTNDPYSWNFNITVIDAAGLKAWKNDEYGVYKFTSILPNQDWVNVIAPPGFWDASSIVTITYSSNYDFNMTIYFEENLTNTTWGDIISIANNVYILGGADPNDDVTYDVMFAGIGEANAVDIFNDSGIFHSNNISQTVNVQFNVYIPLGTHGGKYTARVATKIMQD